MRVIFEVCAGSYQDCIQAYKGKANRVELNSALSVGGLSAMVSTLKKVKEDTNLKVICMVRVRPGGFVYDKDDFDLMMTQTKDFLENGADGIAFGFLKEDGGIDVKRTKQMVDFIHSYHKEAVFHRAFDITKDPIVSIQQLIDCHVDRVLTSGQKEKAIDGIHLLKYLQSNFGQQIEIMAGSGIDKENVLDIIQQTGIYQVHSSCKGYKLDLTTCSQFVSFSYLNPPYSSYYDVVDIEKVKEIGELLKK